MTEFYRALAEVSFTILGLWLLVVELRWKIWGGGTEHPAAIRAVVIQLALPGFMSLFSLADPDGSTLWRVGFTVLAVLGAVALVLLRDEATRGRSALAVAGHWLAVAIHVAVAVVAVLADPLTTGGVDALQVEAVLLTVLLLLSLNTAVSLLPAGTAAERASGEQR